MIEISTNVVTYLVTGLIGVLFLIIGYFVSNKINQAEKVIDKVSELETNFSKMLMTISFHEKRIDAAFVKFDELKKQLKGN